MNYQFTKEFESKSPDEIWIGVKNELAEGAELYSIRNIPYTIQRMSDTEICFTAKSRNNGKEEIISQYDFKKVINELQQNEVINTSISKLAFRGSKIYKKRSPFFAILLSQNIVERI